MPSITDAPSRRISEHAAPVCGFSEGGSGASRLRPAMLPFRLDGVSAAAAPATTLRPAGASRVVERLARALEREVVPDAVVVAVPRSIALAQRVAAVLELPLEVAPVVTVGASKPGVETAAVTPDGDVYVWDGTGVDGKRLAAAALHAVDRARALETRVRRRRSGNEGTWLLVARGATGPAETVAALRWLRRQGNGRFVAAAAEWDDESASAATAWADRVVGAASGGTHPRIRRPRPLLPR